MTLEDCLKAFAKEEKLEDNELWYCSRCKAHQPAAKKLDIWALPPYLVVHLKRFHMHNGRWMKSTAHVSFPLRDLQPAKCMPRVTENTSAAKPGEANEAEAAAATKTGDISHSNGSSSPSQQQNDVGQPALAANNSGYASSEPSEATTELINSNGGPKTVSATAADHVQSNLVSGGSSGANSAESVRATVVNAAAASLTPAAGSADPPLSRELPPDSVPCGESPAFSAPFAERHYDLYAVACHEGIMGGGHYVAYALNEETGNWYFFNDSSCRKVRLGWNGVGEEVGARGEGTA